MAKKRQKNDYFTEIIHGRVKKTEFDNYIDTALEIHVKDISVINSREDHTPVYHYIHFKQPISNYNYIYINHDRYGIIPKLRIKQKAYHELLIQREKESKEHQRRAEQRKKREKIKEIHYEKKNRATHFKKLKSQGFPITYAIYNPFENSLKIHLYETWKIIDPLTHGLPGGTYQRRDNEQDALDFFIEKNLLSHDDFIYYRVDLGLLSDRHCEIEIKLIESADKNFCENEFFNFDDAIAYINAYQSTL